MQKEKNYNYKKKNFPLVKCLPAEASARAGQWLMVNCQRGILTLEMLIAMTLMVLAVSAVMPLVSGGQSTSISSHTNQEALYKAQALLEGARANSLVDFNLVNPVSPVQEDIYTEKIDVIIDPSDPFTKKVTSSISWPGATGQNLSINLVTLVTNPEAVNGGNTCSSVLEGDWTNPKKTEYQFGSDILNDNSSGFPITSIQAFNHRLYVTVNNASGNNPGTFFILNIADPSSMPVLVSPPQFDNNAKVGAGLNAVAVNGGHYAYVANGYGANFNTCVNDTGNNYSCGQLQVINISDETNPFMQYSLKLPGISGQGGQAIGKSIFFKNGIIYLGLAKTGAGPEFNMIDVGDGSFGGSPSNPVYMGGFYVGSAVNSIEVKGNYAYIATPDSEELKILDISDPNNIYRVGGFDAPDGGGNFGNGKSSFLVGNRLYFGRTLLSGREFYILDDSNPTNPTGLPVLGSKDIQDGGGNNLSVNGIVVRDFLTFLITSKELHILRTDDPSNISQYAVPLPLPPGGNTNAIASDCEMNYLFIGSQGANDKGHISVITSGN